MFALNNTPKKPLGTRLLFAGAALFLAGHIVFCTFYLLSGHDHLASWFSSLNPCFYRAARWTGMYFTVETKHTGNYFCIADIIISLCGLYYLRRSYINYTKSLLPTIGNKKELALPLLFLTVWSAIAWRYGSKMTAPSFDEVFSAVNCAGSRPFHALAYYMLPNNHVLFNVINSFSPFSDKVFSGRLISLAAYILFNGISFTFFSAWFQNRWYALLAALMLSFQFALWGFSFQGRGYEIFALMHLLAFCSLISYILSNDERWLRLNAISCIIGYCCVPTFLYFHAAQLAFCLCYCLLFKQTLRASWKYHVIILLSAVVWYTPALCFSGTGAVLHNKYVSPGEGTPGSFMAHIYSTLEIYTHYCFSLADGKRESIIAGVLFFLPLVLFIGRGNKTKVLAGLFYFSLWAVTILFFIVMKKSPFHRTLIGHYAITFFTLIYTFHTIFKFISDKAGAAFLTPILMLAVFIPAGVYLFRTGTANVSQNLYFNEINGTNKLVNDGMSQIPPNSTVACSDESFYFYYIAKRRGLNAHKCIEGNEDFFMNNDEEPMPAAMQHNYDPVEHIMDYTLYKRK